MESSSEDSFTWTETSQDSIGSDSMAVDENVNSKSDKKHGRKRKTKEISGDCYNGTEEDDSKIKVKIEKEQLQSEAKTKESMKRKLVKSEPESDCDVPKKKKKKKSIEVNGNHNESQDSYDESHLDLKVKEEQTSAPSSKKKRKQSIIDPENTENAEEFKIKDNSSDIGEETVKHKKKKKKSKKRNDSEAEDGMEIEYKEDTTETAINTSNSKRSINKSIENSTFQDESSYEEISAIQCDGDSNSHTISFNDSQTVVKDNRKKNDTLYKSTVVNQFKMSNNAHDVSQEPQKRTPRISDRIRFEDEDDPVTDYSEVQEEKQDSTSTKLRKFIKSNNDVKLVSQKLEHNSVLTEEDEIWIVKCPKEIDIHSFCDRDLNLNGKCKIKVDGQTYEGSLDEDQSETIAALSMEHGKYEVENLPLCGIINFRKRIPKPHFHNDNVMLNNQTNFIPLPETKCRHPLFGLNYKKAIKVPAAVAGRLNADNNVEESETVVKRKKKKHKKDKDADDYEEADSNSMTPEPDISPEKLEKKKKKRKHVNDADVVDGPAPKKVKKIKHDPESAEAWESEKAIEENLFNF